MKLIISYSDKRAKKDKRNREKGLKRLEKKIKLGKLTKSNINNRGYNKYLQMDGQVDITIDYAKFKSDGKWDGIIQNIHQIEIYLPSTNESFKKTLILTEEQQRVAKLFDF